MSREHLLDITPVHFRALCEADAARQLRSSQVLEYMLAQLTACTTNFSMRGPKEPLKTADFLLRRDHQPREVKPPRKRRESRQKIADRLQLQMSAMMG